LAVASAAAWLTGCERAEQAPPPRVHHKAKTAVVEKKAPKTAKPVVAGTIQYLDLKNGFRDVVFGTPVTNFTDLVLKEKDDAAQSATYTRSGDVLTLAGLPLQEIDYSFFQDQLAKVVVKWKVEYTDSDFSIPPASGLAANCTELYGHPKQQTIRADSSEYVWLGSKVKIFLDELKMPGLANRGGGWAIAPVNTGEMVIESLPLRQQMDAYLSNRSDQDNKAGL
jgi:hypothetical protein